MRESRRSKADQAASSESPASCEKIFVNRLQVLRGLASEVGGVSGAGGAAAEAEPTIGARQELL